MGVQGPPLPGFKGCPLAFPSPFSQKVNKWTLKCIMLRLAGLKCITPRLCYALLVANARKKPPCS